MELKDYEINIAKVCHDEGRDGLGIVLVLAVEEYGLKEDVLDFLKTNRNPSADDLADLIKALCPPIEIIDEEE